MATITVGENSYVDESELTTYASDRGITLSTDTDELIIKAMDWLELRPFKGSKADETQDLEWPRTGVFVNGEELDETLIPSRIKQAEMAAAVLIDQGEDLQPTVGQRVLSQSVDGAVSVTYSDKGNQTNIQTKLNDLLRPYLTSAGGTQFTVSRA